MSGLKMTNLYYIKINAINKQYPYLANKMQFKNLTKSQALTKSN